MNYLNLIRAFFRKSIFPKTLQGNNNLRKVSLSLFFIICAFSCFFSLYAAAKFDFYYFNPDSAQSNFSQLTKGFTHFLKQAGADVGFQAFTQKVDFDRRVKDKRPAFVLVPSWYYRKYGGALGLTPLLTSLENGKPNYTKILLVRKAAPFTVAELKGRTVAMTTMGSDTEELLSKNFFQDQQVDFSTMNVIITPKDADALYALALGQVDAALVGQATLNIVGNANHRVLQGIQKLIPSSPIPMPLLCALPGTMDKTEIERLKQTFQEGGQRATLPQYMEMLHIDGWKNIL